MWNALRTDLKEFVSTVADDTSNALSKIDANFPDEGDAAQTPQAVEAARRMALAETFTAPLRNLKHEEEDDDAEEEDEDDDENQEIETFLAAFSIDAKTEEIAALLEMHPDSLKVMFEALVPAVVPYDTFWQAYFYRCDADRIARQWAEDDERAKEARQAAMTAGITQVKSFLGGAVNAVSAVSHSLQEDDEDGTTTASALEAQVTGKGGFFSGAVRPPFVMNTAVDEDDDEEDEEELGWDDEDEFDVDDEEVDESVITNEIEFSDQVTEKLQEELKQALEERDLLQQTVELQTKEIAKLSLEGTEKTNADAAVETSGDRNSELVEKLQKELEVKTSELETLQCDQVAAVPAVSDSDEKVASLQHDINGLTGNLEAKNAELSEMQTLLQNSMNELKDMMAVRDEEKAALNDAVADSPELISKVESLEAELSTLQSENQRLREASEANKAAELSTLQSALDAKVKSLEEELSTLQSENENLRETSTADKPALHDAKSTDSSELDGKVASLEAELATVRADNESLCETLEADKAALNDAQAKTADSSEMEEKVQSLGEELATVRAENDVAKGDLESRVAELEQGLAASEQQAVTATSHLETVQADLASLEQNLVSSEEQAVAVTSELEKVKADFASAEKRAADLEQELVTTKEGLQEKQESEVTSQEEAAVSRDSPTDTVSTGIAVDAPVAAEKLGGDDDDWGDDWGDDEDA